MRRDDRDDPFGDIFDEIERMMQHMADADDAGFGSETHVDVYQEGETVRLVADLPGITKDQLGLQCDGTTLTISAASDRREYDERIRLPVPVDEHSARATFNHGILEVTFDRAEDTADIDVE